MPFLLRRRLPLALLVLVCGSGGAALAQAGPSGAARPTPEQLQRIFPEQRRLAISDHRARIAILQSGERCLSAAASSEALRSCMKQEREAVQRQRQQHWAAMRALMEQNGLPVPQWGAGDRKGRWGSGSKDSPNSI